MWSLIAECWTGEGRHLDGTFARVKLSRVKRKKSAILLSGREHNLLVTLEIEQKQQIFRKNKYFEPWQTCWGILPRVWQFERCKPEPCRSPGPSSPPSDRTCNIHMLTHKLTVPSRITHTSWQSANITGEKQHWTVSFDNVLHADFFFTSTIFFSSLGFKTIHSYYPINSRN